MQMGVDESRENDLIPRLECSGRAKARLQVSRLSHCHDPIFVDGDCSLADEPSAFIHRNHPVGPSDEQIDCLTSPRFYGI
jgi:hypothetical protein